MNYAIILAGGSGTRFWPLSRKLKPKQFLNICSKDTLIEETIRRVSSIVKRKNIYIAANKEHYAQIIKCLGKTGIPRENLFLEPAGRNTLAPVAVLSKLIHDCDSDAVISVFPSDHFVKGANKFAAGLRSAAAAAEKGFIVTLGIPPSAPETGYGYIKAMAAGCRLQAAAGCFKIEKFVEKPGLDKAKQFIKDGRYYWNSGIFIFKAEVMLDELQRHLPRAYKAISRIKNKKDAGRLWGLLPHTSIDYGIMEDTDKGVMLATKFSWTDLGNWQAAADFLMGKKSGNLLRGDCFDMESKDIFVWSGSQFVATLGLKDTIIVSSGGSLLVCAKDRVQDVKKLVLSLEKKGFKKYL